MRAEPALRIGALGLVALVTPLAPITPAAVPTVQAQSSGPSAQVHQVRHGDTLSGIAGRYGVSVPSIMAANGMTPGSTRLKPGQRLAIPAATVQRAGSSATQATSTPERVTSQKATSATVPNKTVRVRPAAYRLPRDFFLAVPNFQELLPPAFQWPVDGPVSSTFGQRRRGWHRGIDIKADRGTPVIAAAMGLVIASFVEPRYGNVVKIAHDNGFLTVYAHNQRNLVDVGDWVVPGQRIATIGRTGRATGEHLHFEIRHEGMVYNPLYLLPMPSLTATTDDTDLGEHDEE